MDRRDFLRKGAVAGSVGVLAGSTPSCLLLPSLMRMGDFGELPDMDAYPKVVDGGMLKIASGSVFESKGLAASQEEEQLVRDTFGTLYMSGMFGDLPEAAQLHPGMQERMWGCMPQMDEAALGMMARLEALTPSQRKDLHAVLKQRENPTMQVAGEIDALAKATGVSKARRAQTRMMFSHLAMRMAHQSPDLVIDELLARSRKMLARAGSAEDMEKLLAARIGEKALIERQSRYNDIATMWQQRCGLKYADPPGTNLLKAGGILMGLCVVFAAIGGLIAGLSGDPGGWIGGGILLTIGGLLLLAGIITLAIGGARRHEWKKQMEE